jgi:ATP-dependent exoDNAse (exonuclease V) beta subunit
MRLAFPAADSLGLWELDELGGEENEAEADEGARLVYVAATRAEDRLILSGTYREDEADPCETPKPSDSPLRRVLPALRERGWDGGNGSVELSSPTDAEGRPVDVPTRLRVSVNVASAEAAASLARKHERSREPAASPGGRPPLRGAAPPPAPVGHLSYSALAGYERCGYRFYAERVLRLAAPLAQLGGDDAAPADDEPADAPSEVVEPPPHEGDAEGIARAPIPALERGLAIGNAVHAALEASALAGWARPADDGIGRLLATEGLAGDRDALERARGLVDAWLGSELRARLDGMSLRPEVPFVVGIGPAVVRGQIDLLARGDAEAPLVIDFKSDSLRGRDPEAAAGRYAAQQEVYALAAAGTGDGGVTTVHCFLEAPERPVERSFDADGLNAARSRLEGMIERMRAGEFEPTPEPDSATCFGCPAAARLCPHPKWRPPGG